jgi:hypothetical protein
MLDCLPTGDRRAPLVLAASADALEGLRRDSEARARRELAIDLFGGMGALDAAESALLKRLRGAGGGGVDGG